METPANGNKKLIVASHRKRNIRSQTQALSKIAKGMEDLAGAQIKKTKLIIEADKLIMQRLCNITLAITIYFRLNNRHSVFLCNIRKRPFNMPYAFSHTTLALHSFLLKYFSILSDVPSRKTFITQVCFGKALSPTVTKGIFPCFSKSILIQELRAQ